MVWISLISVSSSLLWTAFALLIFSYVCYLMNAVSNGINFLLCYSRLAVNSSLWNVNPQAANLFFLFPLLSCQTLDKKNNVSQRFGLTEIHFFSLLLLLCQPIYFYFLFLNSWGWHETKEKRNPQAVPHNENQTDAMLDCLLLLDDGWFLLLSPWRPAYEKLVVDELWLTLPWLSFNLLQLVFHSPQLLFSSSFMYSQIGFTSSRFSRFISFQHGSA